MNFDGVQSITRTLQRSGGRVIASATRAKDVVVERDCSAPGILKALTSE
jgi:hypothetical protein